MAVLIQHGNLDCRLHLLALLRVTGLNPEVEPGGAALPPRHRPTSTATPPVSPGLLATARKLTNPTPETTAFSVLTPELGPRVQRTRASPLSSVVLVVALTLPPPGQLPKSRLGWGRRFRLSSSSRTTSGWLSSWFGAAGLIVPRNQNQPARASRSSVAVKETGEPSRPSLEAVAV